MVDGHEAVPDRFRPSISAVVDRLAAKDYEGLKRDGTDPYPDADLSMWIRDYGGSGATIVSLPDEAWDVATALELADQPGTWHVVVDLWTEEEGHSDLSMEALVIETDDGPVVRVHDIHVL
jgi:hypothetical protein